MTDTEARRLAEQYAKYEPFHPSIKLTKANDLNSQAAIVVSRAYLDLLTRLETPGLTQDEQSVVLNARAGNVHSWDVPRLLAIIDRLTQPTSTAGEERPSAPFAHLAGCPAVNGYPCTCAPVTTAPAVDAGGG